MESTAHLRYSRTRGTYTTRILACLALALGVLIVLARAPLYQPLERVGWQVTSESSDPVLTLIDIREADEHTPVAVAGAQMFDSDAVSEEDEEVDNVVETETHEEETETQPEPEQPLRLVYESADEMPAIEGGLTSYYINIDYPRAAVIAGIEGTLLLRFVVEPSGRPSGIEVVESLHPLCDSAAVRALRRTRFVPGVQNGRRVPVRMQLPVRFEIVNDRVATSETGEQ